MADWTLLHAQIEQTLKQQQLLPRQQSVLVAVSGGQDSLCLLRLLLDLQPKWGWQLAVAHCDHRWRSDATANATYVQQLSQSFQLPYYGATAAQPLPSEAAARQWRYQALTEIAIEHNYAYVATGHTASDRAETLLYNLMRGSGADGLQALSWSRALSSTVQLVRPLLTVLRSETAQFCHQANLKIWFDSTNQDQRYVRNRIRQQLLPDLQQFNPQVEQTLAQTAELLRADVEYLEAAASDLWHQVIELKTAPALTKDSGYRLQRRLLRSAPLSLQRRVIRRLLQLQLSVAPTYQQIEKLRLLLTAPNRSQTDPFPGGAIARVEGDWIHFLEPPQ